MKDDLRQQGLVWIRKMDDSIIGQHGEGFLKVEGIKEDLQANVRFSVFYGNWRYFL